MSGVASSVRSLGEILALGLVAALFLAGCGDNDETDTAAKSPQKLQTVHITLNGLVGPENAAVLMAEARGYFRDAGLKAIVTSPQKPRRTVHYVKNGLVEIGVSHQPQVVLAVEKGVPIVAFNSLISQPTAALIWLRGSGIHKLRDLKGKTIAFPGVQFQKALLADILSRGGLTLDDVQVRRMGYHLVQVLESGRVDAIFGGSWNLEGAELEARHQRPVITRVQSLGIPAYDELVLIARTDLLSSDARLIRAVNRAVARGAAAAIENPEAVVDLIEESAETYFGVSRRTVERKTLATLPLLSESGEMDPAQAERLIDWMQGEGMIPQKIPVSALLTNELLSRPGQE